MYKLDLEKAEKPVANIHEIIEKARDFCFIDYAKAFDWVHHNTVENS